MLLNCSSSLLSQKITVIGTNINGIKDTVQFGFADLATLGEDPGLGEKNLFGTPLSDYEIRILQRDEANHECSLSEVNGTEIIYPENFDSKINLRSELDTSLSNRLFEIWFSDNSSDSIEIISEVNLHGFLSGYSYIHECDNPEFPPPVGILVVEDTTYHVAYKVTPGLWVKEFVFILFPQDVTTSVDKTEDVIQDVTIYPNPVTDRFMIKNSLDPVAKIVIQNLHGQVIENIYNPPLNSEISLQSLAGGLYIVHIWLDSGHKIAKRVLKQ